MAKSIQFYASDNLLEEFYNNLVSQNEKYFKRVHIPKSDVVYIRRAYYEATGNWETLDRIERSMYLEGMIDGKDCFEPHRKRDWEN